jgi:hypothetical protein
MAWVRDLFERIDVDSRESHAVTVWKAATDEGVNRRDSVSEWLRRAGPSRLLNERGGSAERGRVTLPRPGRSRAWLKVAPLECQGCRQVVERRSPVQRYCHDCADARGRVRSRESMTRRRDRRT